MRKSTYDKRTLNKAKTLFKKGETLRSIKEKTGIKSHTTILYYCDPEYRAQQNERHRNWRKKNPERWKEINRKSVKKYQEKKLSLQH